MSTSSTENDPEDVNHRSFWMVCAPLLLLSMLVKKQRGMAFLPQSEGHVTSSQNRVNSFVAQGADLQKSGFTFSLKCQQ